MSGKNLYSAFIMEKLEDNKWRIRVTNYLNSYMEAGTWFEFTKETTGDIIDRIKEDEQ